MSKGAEVRLCGALTLHESALERGFGQVVSGNVGDGR